MARFFDPISEADFRAKLRSWVSTQPEILEEFEFQELIEKSDEDLAACALTWEISAKIARDIEKIDFDLENCYTAKSKVDHTNDRTVDFCGINTLPNGMVYLGVFAGGDWETPVRFIVYHDGSAFRGYVPKDGNTWNLKTKTAYGSEPNGVSVPETQQRSFDYNAIITDIQNRIIRK